jgi:hypothetical protein
MVLLGVTLHATAQSFICSNPATPGFVGFGFLNVTPTMPLTTQPISITVGRIAYTADSVVAQIQGNVINVNLTGQFIALTTPPPIPCLTVLVAPLAAGTYTVNAYIINRGDDPSVPPSLFASAVLTVAAAPREIPALGGFGLSVLIFSLIVAAGCAIQAHVSPNLSVNRTRRYMLSTWRASRRRAGYLRR